MRHTRAESLATELLTTEATETIDTVSSVDSTCSSTSCEPNCRPNHYIVLHMLWIVTSFSYGYRCCAQRTKRIAASSGLSCMGVDSFFNEMFAAVALSLTMKLLSCYLWQNEVGPVPVRDFCDLYTETCDYVSFTSSYITATRFERVEILVEMGEWMTGRGLSRAGCDYFHSALDLLYDVEEKVRVVSYSLTLEYREARCPMIHLFQTYCPRSSPVK